MHKDLPERVEVVIKLMDQAERKIELIEMMIMQLCTWREGEIDITLANLVRVLENAESVHKQYRLSADCLRVIYEDIKIGESE